MSAAPTAEQPQRSDRPSPRLGRARSLAYSSLIVAILLGAAEGTARLIGVPDPVKPRILLRSMDMDVSFPFMRADPELFWSLVPGWRGEFQGRRVTIGALGLRGAAPARPKPRGRRRLACFGDSITFGLGLSDDETYPACLGRRLAQRDVEVVNAGTTGYTSHQVLGLLRRLAPRLEADLATFCVGWNDGNERAMNDRDYARRLRAVTAIESSLGRLALFRAAKGLYLRTQAREVRRAGAAGTAAYRASEPTGQGARVPVAQYRENLAAIAAECRARGIRPLFVALPMRRRPGDAAYDSPYARALAESGRELGVPVLALGALQLGVSELDTEAQFLDSIHFSAEGAERAADEIARQLVELGVL